MTIHRWRQRLKELAHGARGMAAVEMAMILPVLVLISGGAIDFARLFYAYVTVASAAHETAMYLEQNPAALTADLQSVAVAESQGASGSLLSFSGTPNASLTTPALVSGTTNTTLFVRVRLSYTFQPLMSIPREGSIVVSATADAPIMRALTTLT